MRMFDTRSLLVLAVVAALSSTLMGCPDKASPDPAAGKDGGTTAIAPNCLIEPLCASLQVVFNLLNPPDITRW